jgi:hypothetical protein
MVRRPEVKRQQDRRLRLPVLMILSIYLAADGKKTGSKKAAG